MEHTCWPDKFSCSPKWISLLCGSCKPLQALDTLPSLEVTLLLILSFVYMSVSKNSTGKCITPTGEDKFASLTWVLVRPALDPPVDCAVVCACPTSLHWSNGIPLCKKYSWIPCTWSSHAYFHHIRFSADSALATLGAFQSSQSGQSSQSALLLF